MRRDVVQGAHDLGVLSGWRRDAGVVAGDLLLQLAAGRIVGGPGRCVTFAAVTELEGARLVEPLQPHHRHAAQEHLLPVGVAVGDPTPDDQRHADDDRDHSHRTVAHDCSSPAVTKL